MPRQTQLAARSAGCGRRRRAPDREPVPRLVRGDHRLHGLRVHRPAAGALALATIASLAGAWGWVSAPSPAISLAVAVFTIFVVVSQIINDPPAVVGPGGQDQDIGIWLALSGGALMVAGAVLGYASISLAFEPRQRARADERGPDRDVTSVPTPGAPDMPEPEPRRPVASDDDPTRPLSDPASPRRPDDPHGPERRRLRGGGRAGRMPRPSRRRWPRRWGGCWRGAAPWSCAAGWAA